MSCRWNLKEVSHEMRFWEIADARNPVFFETKSVLEGRWSTSAVRRVRDMVGSWSAGSALQIRFQVFSVHARSKKFYCVLQVGSFPECKWDTKWCWWMSCQWSFEGSLAQNAFFLLLAPVIFLLKIILRSASNFFRFGVEILFWSYNADRIGMAAWRLLLALAACVMYFAASSRISFWTGCMKAAKWNCKRIFSSLALVFFCCT